MLRSILAIVAGYAITAVLIIVVTGGAAALLGVSDGKLSTPYLVVNLTGSTAAGVVGGFVAARLSPRAVGVHVGLLAVLLFAMSLPAVFGGAATGQPAWYPGAIAVLGPAAVAVGGAWAWARRPDPFPTDRPS